MRLHRAAPYPSVNPAGVVCARATITFPELTDTVVSNRCRQQARSRPGGGLRGVSDATVNADSSVYYQAGYWNDLLQVREHLNRRATGDPDVDWSQYLLNWRGRPFAKALILNCSNGWVERGLVR